MALDPPLPLLVGDAVAAALREDLGRAGDLTTAALIPPEARARCTIVARDFGVLAGLPLARAAFAALDPAAAFDAHAGDGDRVADGAEVATIAGNARALLSAERVALNFLCHLSGIATATAALVDRVKHTRARIVDTRKTTPGLRAPSRSMRCVAAAA